MTSGLNRCPLGAKCRLDVELTEPIQGPLHLHLAFEDFFQPLKPFATSVPLYQLDGHKQP